MKVAVVHDRLDVRGGAERVVISLAKAFDADIFTLQFDSENTFENVKNVNIKELTSIKLKEDLIPWSYPFYHLSGMLRFLTLDLSDYDLVFTSGKLGHFSKGKKTIWYCHTPPRFLYDLKKFVLEYLEEKHGPIARGLAVPWWKIWRMFDTYAAELPNRIVTNSRQVKRRVKKFYGREATVVNPPVKIEKFIHKQPEDYFLSIQRPSPEKRIELQLKIFEKLEDENLIMIGDYENENYKRKIRKKVEKLENVKWIKQVNEKKLIDLYSKCKAVIQTSKNEDFGIVPIEAMASGKPALAVKEGGFKETILDGKTGFLIEKPYVQNFVKYLKEFDPSKFSSKECKKRAKEFSEKKFIKKMENKSKF